MGVHIHCQGDNVNVSRALSVSEKSTLYSLSACKKRKFTLLELIRGARKYLTTGDPTVAANITDYFTESNKADKITLHGVALGNGFKLSGVPKKNPNISVTHDGRPIIKGSIRSGNVQFTLRKTSNTGVSEAQILLNCATKAKKRHSERIRGILRDAPAEKSKFPALPDRE